jgi:predicted secreted protein
MRPTRDRCDPTRPATPSAALALLTLLALAPMAMAEGPSRYERVSLTAVASEAVANDLMRAVLYVERQGEDPRSLAAGVNEAMRHALDAASAEPAVTARTLHYRTTPVYERNRLTGWRVRQSMLLESPDDAVLARLVGALQDRLAVESIEHDLTPEARETAEEALIARAIAGFRQRADLVAREFGRDRYRLVEAEIHTERSAPPMGPMRMAVMAEGAPPAVEAGEQTVSVTLRGIIELQLP